MAQVSTEKTQSPIEPEKLIEFIDELRHSGFNIGTQQYFAVQDLLVLLAARGCLPAEPEALKTWLAPILCSSPKEQESFYREFDHWLEQRQKPKRKRLIKPRDREGTRTSRLGILRSRRTMLAVGMCLLLTVGALVFFKFKRRSTPQQSNAPVATTSPSPVASTDKPKPTVVSQDDRPTMTLTAASSSATPVATPVAQRKRFVEVYSTYFKQIRAVAVGLPFLIVGIWWLRRTYRSRSLLEKWSTTEKPRLDQVTVGGVSAGLFREPGFRRIAQELRRHRVAASFDLDVQPTVGATIRAGGWFTPIYSSRRVSPEYLVLIDRATFRDQQAQLEDRLISRLVEDNVFVDRYYFHRDPRICRREDPAAPHLTLRDLAALHPDHYLIIFSDGAGLFNPLSGRPQRWLESFSAWPGRALLTEASIADWGYREWALSGSGFVVSPVSKAGLELLLETINARASQRTIVGDWSQHYPKQLQERPGRWLEPSAPDSAVVNELCEQLRAFLGDEDYGWLGACAVYPVLQWDLTLYFGIKLTDRERFEERLLSLVRLPWFRQGVMPDWFRQRLISDLSPDRERTIREALADLLITSLEQPSKGFTLEVARQASRETRPWQKALRFIERTTRSRRLKNLLQAWIDTEPEHSPLRDYVFLRFVASNKVNKLAVSVPSILRRVLRPQRAILGVRPIMALLLATTVSVFAWIAITRTQPISKPVEPNLTTKVDNQPVTITEMYMAKDDGRGRPGTPTTSFDQSDATQYCVVKLKAAQPETRIIFSWRKMPKELNVVDDESVTVGPADKVEASLSLPRDERNGAYSVTASLDDNSLNRVEYTFVSSERAATQTASSRGRTSANPELDFVPDQQTAQANGVSRAIFQVAFLVPPPTGTLVRIRVDPPAQIIYRDQVVGNQVDIKLADGEAVSDQIYVMSGTPGVIRVRGQVLPDGPSAFAAVTFTLPRPSQIVFDDEPRDILSSQTTPISVRLTDDNGRPVAADRPVTIDLYAADDAGPVLFDPPSVGVPPGSSSAQSKLLLKALPKSDVTLLAQSRNGEIKPARKTFTIRNKKVSLSGPIEMTKGATAEFIIRLADKDGAPSVADWDRTILLSASLGSLTRDRVTIPKGESRATVRYLPPNSTTGKVLLKAECEGLAEGSLEITVVIALYWLVLAALLGGLAGGVILTLIKKDYRTIRILPMWTGERWDMGLISRVVGSIAGGVTFYLILKMGVSRVIFQALPDLNLGHPMVAFFLGAIAGFGSPGLFEQLSYLILRGSKGTPTRPTPT